jgi:hypothetical protein
MRGPVAGPARHNAGATPARLSNQIGAMQNALKDDEELVIHLQNGEDKIRAMEIFLASPQAAVRTGNAQSGAKAVRVNLVVPRGK